MSRITVAGRHAAAWICAPAPGGVPDEEHVTSRPVAVTLAVLAAFLFCVFASADFHWHTPVTGPAAAVCALGLVACGAWLNRSAGAGDGSEDDEEGES